MDQGNETETVTVTVTALRHDTSRNSGVDALHSVGGTY